MIWIRLTYDVSHTKSVDFICADIAGNMVVYFMTLLDQLAPHIPRIRKNDEPAHKVILEIKMQYIFGAPVGMTARQFRDLTAIHAKYCGGG